MDRFRKTWRLNSLPDRQNQFGLLHNKRLIAHILLELTEMPRLELFQACKYTKKAISRAHCLPPKASICLARSERSLISLTADDCVP